MGRAFGNSGGAQPGNDEPIHERMIETRLKIGLLLVYYSHSTEGSPEVAGPRRSIAWPLTPNELTNRVSWLAAANLKHFNSKTLHLAGPCTSAKGGGI
jgi:hypothetical protein